MRFATTLVSAIVLFGVSCSGSSSAPLMAAASLTPLLGSSIQGVSLTSSSDKVEVSFAPSATAVFVKLNLPEGTSPLDWNWVGETGAALTFTCAEPGELCLGVMPRDAALTPALIVSVLAGEGVTRSSGTPRAPLAGSLSVQPAGSQVALDWLQDLPGDYNFDGKVSLADLAPLVQVCAHGLDVPVEAASPWLDGDCDGQIGQGDADVVAGNLGLNIAGYRVLRNNGVVPGDGPGGTVLAKQDVPVATPAPARYSLTARGSLDDSWNIVPVDGRGETIGPGSFAGGGVINVAVDVTGAGLLPLPDRVSKIGGRVILPIENIDSWALPMPLMVLDGMITVENVPRGQVVLLEVSYEPDVTLTSAAAQFSMVPHDSVSVTTSIALLIPADSDGLDVQANIALAPENTGGYGMTLTTNSSADGAAIVESAAHLTFDNGQLRRDTNGNGSFEDELVFPDSDRDCISDPLQYQLSQGAPPAAATTPFRISGQLQNFDPGRGMITISGVRPMAGSPAMPPVVNLRFAENMRLNPIPGDRLPEVGEYVEVFAFSVEETGGQAYWVSAIHPLVSGFAASIAVQLEADGSHFISWTPSEVFAAYKLIRFSAAYNSLGPGGPCNYSAPNLVPDWSRLLPGGSSSYSDPAIDPELNYMYELYGELPGGGDIYLGVFRRLREMIPMS